MSPDQRRAVEHDAGRAVVSFFNHLDACEYDKLCALMAPDGVWHRQGKALHGPAEVMAAMQARPAGVITQHTVTNLVVDVADADHAAAAMYLLVFSHTGGAPAPAPLELPSLVGVYRAKMINTAAGWRIAEMTSQPRFRR
jgi:ketosteroid isomerase-like protein